MMMMSNSSPQLSKTQKGAIFLCVRGEQVAISILELCFISIGPSYTFHAQPFLFLFTSICFTYLIELM